MINLLKPILDNKRKIFSLLLVISIIIIIGGVLFYNYEKKSILQQKYIELKTVADLKHRQFEQWINEIIAEVNVSTKSSFLSKAISLWNNTGNYKLKNEILNRIKVIQEELHFENIFIFSSDGNLMFSSSQHPEEIDLIVKQKLTEAYKTKKLILTDLYFCRVEKKIHYDIITPMFDDHKNIIALVLFRKDPNRFLFPLIQSWPTPSQSAETVILRSEGDYLIFLHDLRHKKNTALNFKIPKTEIEVPSVQAAFGREGFFEGVDYRGVEVVSDIRKIPLTDWIMVAKIDKSEIYSEIYLTAGIVSGFVLLIIVILSVGLAFIYNSRQKDIYQELYKKEKEIWQNQEKFKVTMDSLGEGIIITDINAKIQYMNKIAEDLTKWNFRDAKGRKLSEVYLVKNEKTGLIENNILDKIFKHGIVKELANHTILVSKSNKEIPVMDTGAPIYDSDGSVTGIVIAFQDETEKRTQQKLLIESEARFRSTLDDMIEGCQILDHNWKYLYINDSAERHNRRPKSELLGKIYMDMWPNIESTEVFSVIKKCMEQRISHSMENEFKFPDGKIGWFKLNLEPVKEGVLILSADITNQKLAEVKLKANEIYLSTLFDSIADAILTVSMPNRIIQNTNSAVFNMLGYEQSEVIGKTTRIFYPNDKLYLDYGEKLNKAIKENIPYVKKEMELIKKDGTKIYCDVQTTFLKNNDSVATVISVLRDITQKKIEELELIKAKEKAEESDRLKSEFLAQISHEIRTPLNVIQGNAAFIKSEVIEQLSRENSSQYEDIFEGIDHSSKRIIRTVDLILNMAEVQVGAYKPHFKKLDLNKDIINTLLNEHLQLARSKNLILEYRSKIEDTIIYADEYSVTQILANLIDNAIKFTNEGKVELMCYQDDNGNISVAVKDTGIGMSEEFMRTMFEPFVQEEHGYTRAYDGNGLGLALVKKYCDVNNAEIKVESTKGIGSTFNVIFKK